MSERTCQACGGTFEQSGDGRPRRWCRTCAPPIGEVGANAYMKAWYALTNGGQNVDKHGRDTRRGQRRCRPIGAEIARGTPK